MPGHHVNGRTITTSEAARLLGLSTEMTRTLAKRGDLPAYRAGERSTLFAREDVERLAERRRLRPPRQGPKPKPKESA
jgi:excisionase family DNA binding protein